MITLVENKFEGLYAAPDHPVTCANPAPWLIEEMKIEANPLKVRIRGKKSMWFRADQCFIHTLEECQVYLEDCNERR